MNGRTDTSAYRNAKTQLEETEIEINAKIPGLLNVDSLLRITNNRNQKKKKAEGPTPTDRQTDTASYRDARTWLKS